MMEPKLKVSTGDIQIHPRPNSLWNYEEVMLG